MVRKCCECGCGKSFAPSTPHQRYVNREHQLVGYNNRRRTGSGIVEIPPEALATIDALADRRQIGRNEIVREALDAYLAELLPEREAAPA